MPSGYRSGRELSGVFFTHRTPQGLGPPELRAAEDEVGEKIFRLGHMGYAAEFDTISALAALEQVLAELGLPVDFGASVQAAQKVFAERS